MMKVFLLIPILMTFLSVTSSFSQAGNPDPNFGGGDGLLSITLFDNRPSQGNAVAVQSNGKILVAGFTGVSDNLAYAILLRFNQDGTFDNGFNGTGKILIPTAYTYASAQAMVIQPDKKILLLVNATDTIHERFFIYRFNEDGSPDFTFDEDGIIGDSLNARYLGAGAISLQQDGKILAVGYVGYDDLSDRFWVERFLPDGKVDHSFDGDGTVITSVGEDYTGVQNLLVQTDGKIVAVGYADFNGNYDYVAVRYTVNGSLDQSFSGDGIAQATISNGDDRAYDAALQPDGKIVEIGEAFNSATGHNTFAAARWNADGTLDQSFHGNGMLTLKVSDHSDGATSLVLQPDGKIWITGFAHSDSTGGFDIALVRLNSNGTPDTEFDGNGIKIYEDNTINGSELSEMALQPDGKLVGTGVVRYGFLNTIRVARFTTGLTTSTKEDFLAIKSVSLYPNPAHEKVVMNYDLDQTENITIYLCDVQGRVIQQLMASSERNSGHHVEALTLQEGLVPGNYFVNIQTRDGAKSMMVVIE